MARNEEKQLGKLNRLWLQKEREEGRLKDVREQRPKLSTLNSASAVTKWIPSIKKEIEYYLQQSQLSHYPERKINEFQLHIEALEREYKRFITKLRVLDPTCKHKPWTPRAYCKRRADTHDSEAVVKRRCESHNEDESDFDCHKTKTKERHSETRFQSPVPTRPQSQTSVHVDQDRPHVDQDRPLSDQDRPLSDQDRPHVDQDRPLVDQDRPLSDQDRPLSDQDRPLSDQDRPLVDQDRPLSDQDRPLSFDRTRLAVAAAAFRGPSSRRDSSQTQSLARVLQSGLPNLASLRQTISTQRDDVARDRVSDCEAAARRSGTGRDITGTAEERTGHVLGLDCYSSSDED